MKPIKFLALGSAALLIPAVSFADKPWLKKEGQPKVNPSEVKIAPVTETGIPAPENGQSKVQIAILLDTSGSMRGLIEQTKTQLWSVVNTFIDATQNGKVPFVEVALFEYGNDGLRKENHWIRQIQPLTRDLDKINAELFSLSTNGGSEFCGAVIKQAVDGLKWDRSPNTYKAIFVAGNEPFTQGPIDPSSACREAISKGIIVNTIHCGEETVGVNTGWKAGPLLADGKFMVINHNKAVVHIDAPQDTKILELNGALNKTYVPLGKFGRQRAESQVQLDNLNAASRGNAIQSRAATKASGNYFNGNWDLVDACTLKDFKWENIKEEDLPEEMKKMTLDERKAYVAKKRDERLKLKKKIQDLSKDRATFVEAKLKELGEDKNDTLDQVVTKTVREQAAGKGYTFKKK